MTRSSDESTSLATESDVNVGVQSTLHAIKTAMKSALTVYAIVLNHCDETTRTQTLHILHRYKTICKRAFLVRQARLTFLAYWICFDAHVWKVLESWKVHMRQCWTIWRKWNRWRSTMATKKKQMVRQTCLSHRRSKKRKVESNACLKANKKKLSHPNVWHNCMKPTKQKLSILGKTFPKKGTAYYHEYKNRM